jgi:hypothetical protein
MIGGLAALAFFAAASILSFWWAHSPRGEEIAAMFGSFALGAYGHVALMLVCAALSLLTGLSVARDRHPPFANAAKGAGASGKRARGGLPQMGGDGGTIAANLPSGADLMVEI